MMSPILQVEDDPNDVFFLEHALRKVGVVNPIQVVTDGQQAIDYLKGVGHFADRERFPLPCLVLLDLKLPYVMGLEVLKWIRQQYGAALIVILLTASAEEADIVSAYDLGANAFLTKPSRASKLEEMTRAIKDFWLSQNTLPRESQITAAASDARLRSRQPSGRRPGHGLVSQETKSETASEPRNAKKHCVAF